MLDRKRRATIASFYTHGYRIGDTGRVLDIARYLPEMAQTADALEDALLQVLEASEQVHLATTEDDRALALASLQGATEHAREVLAAPSKPQEETA